MKIDQRGARRIAALAVLTATIAVPAAAQRRGEQITTTGSQAIGTVTVGQTGSVYWLRFSGDETIEYRIDTAIPEVREGIIRIHEASSDSWPLHYAQVFFRDPAGETHSGYWLRTFAHLDSVTVGTDSVVFDFTDDISSYGWGVHHRRYTYELEGKNLRIRVEDRDKKTAYKGNYAGVYLAQTEGTEDPRYIEMQGALMSGITMFRNGGQSWFVTQMLDLYATNAAGYVIDRQAPGGSSFINNIWTGHTNYKPTSGNNTNCGWLDDTYNLTVSSRLRDVLVAPSQGPSPYRGLLTGRTMINLAGSSWQSYSQYWPLLEQWGMDEVAGYFFSWSAPVPGSGGAANIGPTWHPANDPGNFASMVQSGVARGYLLGGYMAFNLLPGYTPGYAYDSSHIARDQNGNWKWTVQSPAYPTIAESASRFHAERETQLFKQHYGGNLAYLDIQSYASPSGGSDGDHLDQTFGAPWARNLSTAIRDRKKWITKMQDTLEGPLVGEGSISGAGSNLEFLWAGYVDSVQRCINTGGSEYAANLPAGSPMAPTNWPVIPEYEWRVMARIQANHGNGFPDRFFGRSDGPGMVDMNTGQPIYPMTEPALDRYRLYEITYGKTAFFGSVGSGNGFPSNGMYHADMIKEHYMMNALQELYYGGRVRTIQYMWNGSLQPFEAIFQQTGTTDSFRHPQLRVTFSNGLEMWLNHSTTPWNVTVAGVSYTIPEDGFVCAQPSTGFVSFSAAAPGTGGQRIDYCYAPHRYEFFDGRGAVGGYGNISTGGTNRLRLQNFVHERTVWENSSGGIQTSQGTPPACVRVDVLPSNIEVIKGKRAGFRAIATYSNGAVRNVTSLVDWSTANGGVAQINDGAALTGTGFGQTQVSVTSFQGAPVVPATVTVVP